MKKQLVSIILLNYNGIKFNEACINSILQQSYQDFEIIFVNNCSTDGSDKEVRSLFHNEIQKGTIVFVQPPYNLGFAGGNNYGVLHANDQSKYICLLNNDTIVPTNWLENLVKGIESNAKLGAVGSIIYDEGHEQVMNNLIFVDKKKGVNNYFFDSVIVNQTIEDMEGDIIYTTGISGCCLLYKKDLLDNPFDDIYFAYMEDTALCMKIILQGYRVGVVKDSTVNHFGSASFGKKPNIFKSFHGLKNYILNFMLLSQGYHWIYILPFFLIGLTIRTLFNHPFIRIQGLAKALRRTISNLKTIYNIRTHIHKQITPKEFYAQLSSQFISTPLYAQVPNRQIKIIDNLNKLCTNYFKLFESTK